MNELFQKFKEGRLSGNEKLEFLEELYWVDWTELEEIIKVEDVFLYLNSEDLSIEEISLILKLYNNPGGDYVKDYSDTISNIYLRDKRKFIKALNLERDQITNLVYLFRNEMVFENEKQDLEEILEVRELSQDEIDTAKEFFKTYERACST